MNERSPNLVERRTAKRREALLLANQVRTAQAELKRRLRDGRVNPVVLLRGQDEMWSRFAFELKVGVLLKSIPTFGRNTVTELLQEAGLLHEDRLKNHSPETIARLVYLVELCLGRE